jgi:ribosome-associated protein
MDIRKLQRAIVDGLEDVKAQHISVFNTEHLSSMFERVIIASGSSNRQTKALAASVRASVKQRGFPVLATEGEDNGEWIIVDCGAAVAHIMQPSIREYYHLEEIWGGKGVRMKMGDVKTTLVKASEPEAVARAAAPKKAPSKKVVAKKAANRSAAYDRVAAAKTPGRKNAPARAAAAKAAAPPAPARKPAAGKTAVGNKAPARKTAAAKAPAGKPPARKAVVRKTPTRRT